MNLAAQLAREFFDEQPHPMAPDLKIKEFATAVKLATALKFGSHATPQEATLFWPHFQALQMSPENFEHVVDRLAPLSYTYHGRPPTMAEIGELRDKSPKEARTYFSDLPDQHYPSVSAGDMVKHLVAAEPHAKQHLQRPPNKYEAQYLAHSGEDPATYYQRLGASKALAAPRINPESNAIPPQGAGDGGGRRAEPTRRPQADQ